MDRASGGGGMTGDRTPQERLAPLIREARRLAELLRTACSPAARAVARHELGMVQRKRRALGAAEGA